MYIQIYDIINIQLIIVSYLFGFFACTTLWSCNIVSEKLLPFMFESFNFDILPAMKARLVNIKLQFLRNYLYLNIYLSLLLHWLHYYQIIMINFINQVILPLLNVDCRTLDQTRWMCYGKRQGLSESFLPFQNRLSYLTYEHQIFSTSDAF